MNDGGGAALYAGGGFLSAGGQPASSFARWKGGAWSATTAVAPGQGLPEGWIRAMEAHDDGSGKALFIGGDFRLPGHSARSGLAKWNGAAWTELYNGPFLNLTLRSFLSFDDGNGPALFVAGAGSSIFEPLGFRPQMGGIAPGPRWAAEGCRRSTRWRFTTTARVRRSMPPARKWGSRPISRRASPDGTARPGRRWARGFFGTIYALAVFDDGGGPALYAAGTFTEIGSSPAKPAGRIAKWNGTSWSTVGGGLDGRVNALAVLDAGGGPALYAAGEFTAAGGAPAARIAKWDGATWSALGSGLGGVSSSSAEELAVYDDGAGDALYVAGSFIDRRRRGRGTVWRAGTAKP